jgi:hypothetical protein
VKRGGGGGSERAKTLITASKSVGAEQICKRMRKFLVVCSLLCTQAKFEVDCSL